MTWHILNPSSTAFGDTLCGMPGKATRIDLLSSAALRWPSTCKACAASCADIDFDTITLGGRLAQMPRKRKFKVPRSRPPNQ